MEQNDKGKCQLMKRSVGDLEISDGRSVKFTMPPFLMSESFLVSLSALSQLHSLCTIEC
jgi:hypothetical protein